MPARPLAIDLFVRRAAAGIAAAATTLPALDALVFTGGIGEHAASVRTRICARLAGIGVSPPLDAETQEGVLVTGGPGRPAILAVHSREDVVIAEAAASSLIS